VPTRLTRLAATLIVGLALVLAPLMAAAGCPSGAMPVGTAAGTAHGGAGTSSTHHHAASKETADGAGHPTGHPPAGMAGHGHGQCCCPCLGARAVAPLRADIPLANGPPAAEPVLAGLPAAPPKPPPRA